MQFSLEIVNEKGLHARASAKFVETVERFDASALVSRDGMEVSGDSIMGLLMLGAARGTSIEVRVEGAEAADAGRGAAGAGRGALRRAELTRDFRAIDGPRAGPAHPRPTRRRGRQVRMVRPERLADRMARYAGAGSLASRNRVLHHVRHDVPHSGREVGRVAQGPVGPVGSLMLFNSVAEQRELGSNILCAPEAGGWMRMKELYVEGVAAYNGPEVMRRRPRGRRRSVDRGNGGLGIEPRNVESPGRRRCREKRKATRRAPSWRGARWPRAVRDPVHAGTPSTRKPGGPWIAWRAFAKPQRQGSGRNPLMHGPGPYSPIVPGKRPNKPGRPGAEAVEGRGGAKGTAGRQSTGRTEPGNESAKPLQEAQEAGTEREAQQRVAGGVRDVERQSRRGEDQVAVDRALRGESHEREEIHPCPEGESRDRADNASTTRGGARAIRRSRPARKRGCRPRVPRCGQAPRRRPRPLPIRASARASTVPDPRKKFDTRAATAPTAKPGPAPSA